MNHGEGACSGAGIYFWGAASLADVPFWRKTKNRLTSIILPRTELFLKLKSIEDEGYRLYFQFDRVRQ
jgi:hypothetical protein